MSWGSILTVVMTVVVFIDKNGNVMLTHALCNIRHSAVEMWWLPPITEPSWRSLMAIWQVFSAVIKFSVLKSSRFCRFMDITSHFNRKAHTLTSHKWSLTSSHNKTFSHFSGQQFCLFFLPKNMCGMKWNDDCTVFKTSQRCWPNSGRP